MTEYKYFVIKELPRSPMRKTSTFVIFNKNSGAALGRIKWYGSWRQYCFFPTQYAETVWSMGCLQDIQGFIGKLMEERKNDSSHN